MGLHFGSGQYTLHLKDGIYRFRLYDSLEEIIKGIMLSSHDGYVLKDCNNLYLTAKEVE